MSVGAFCNRQVVIADRNASILHAAQLMRHHHVGTVVIVENKNGEKVPAGILTDRDIVVELVADQVDLNSVSIGDVMSFELLTVRETEALFDAMQRMQARGVRRAPVVNERGGLVGILTVDDLIDLIAEQLSGLVRLIATEQKKERKQRE